MVLQALTRSTGGRFSSKGDTSATPRNPSLQNSRITSFFSPLTNSPDQSIPTSLPTINGLETRSSSRGDALQRQSSPKTNRREAILKPHTPVTQDPDLSNGRPPVHNEHFTSQARPVKSDTGSSNAPPTVKPSKETRTLRSKEKVNYKSELATYFANYEDIITDAPQAPAFLKVDEPIHVIDEPIKGSTLASPVKLAPVAVPSRPKPQSPAKTRTTEPPLPTNPDAKTIHLSPNPSTTDAKTTDPLPDDMYLVLHRRAERKEKQLRNIEKERAQHEKMQLERILEGLQGPDWLRVLGITGITESEQKDWRPKRDYFIREVTDLVDKFRQWKDEERRLRLEKERAREEAEREDNDGDDESSDSDGDDSDIDAYAAMQLLHEAGLSPDKQSRRKRQYVVYEAPPSPDRPFTSFYRDEHLRAQALGKVRHGRTITAFGVPLPELSEEEFVLFEDWISEDTRRARERKRRRLKRDP